MDTFVDLVLVFRALHRSVDRDGADRPARVDRMAAGRSIYRRHRARDSASALFALLHARHEARPAMSASTSRSPACSRRAWWCTKPTARRTATGSMPADVNIEGMGDARSATLTATGEPIEIGPIEKMSKSKNNTVDPDDIIATYGADTARWFMLSDSPPERDVIWTEEGVQGAWRFVQRLWRLVGEIAEIAGTGTSRPAAFWPEARWRSARPRTGRSGQCLRRHRQAALQPLRRPHLRICQCVQADAIGDGRDRAVARLRLGGARSRRHPGAAVPPDDAASGRGMLGGARPRDAAGDAKPGRRSSRHSWSRTPSRCRSRSTARSAPT